MSGAKGILDERIKQKDEEMARLKNGLTTSRIEEKQIHPLLEFKSFVRNEPSQPRIKIGGITLKNNSDKHLAHCSLRIDNIKASDPSISCAMFGGDPRIKKPIPQETFFQIAAQDHKNIPVAQFDSVNGYLAN